MIALFTNTTDIKDLIRNILIFLRIDLTQNLKYDRLTKQVIKTAVKTHHTCIDVGCHKGEILDLFVNAAPSVPHFGFEPIPSFYQNLKKTYLKQQILPFALSDEEGTTTFQYVKNAPAYSGLKSRTYKTSTPDVEEIQVELKRLDDVIPASTTISFIKIDVEGAEMQVLKGGINLIKKDKPTILFECGLGASDFYGVKPEHVFDFFSNEINYQLNTLDNWLKQKPALNKSEFINLYNTNKEYYFVGTSA